MKENIPARSLSLPLCVACGYHCHPYIVVRHAKFPYFFAPEFDMWSRIFFKLDLGENAAAKHAV